MTINTETITPKQLPGLLEVMHDLQLSCIFVGEPGIGKTQMIEQFAERLSAKCGGHDVPVRTLVLSQIDPVEVRGLTVPDYEAGLTRYLPPEWLPDPEGEQFGILFLDEIDRCGPENQTPAFQMLQERRVGKVRIPPGWLIVAAANGTAFSENTYEFDPALADRLVFYRVAPKASDWLDWGSRTGRINPDVMAFIHKAPDYFSHGAERAASENLLAPSPRGWERVSRVLDARMTPDEQRATIKGIVGEEAATRLYEVLEQIDGESEITTLMETTDEKRLRRLVPASIAGLYRLAYGLTALVGSADGAVQAFRVINALDAAAEKDADLPVREARTLAAEKVMQKLHREVGFHALQQLTESAAYAAYERERAGHLGEAA